MLYANAKNTKLFCNFAVCKVKIEKFLKFFSNDDLILIHNF